MSLLQPADRDVLARAVADTLVVASDPYGREASIFYWDRARPWFTAITRAVRTCGDPAVAQAGKALAADPADPVAYRGFLTALREAPDSAHGIRALLDLGWQAECNSRLGHHMGAAYRPHAEPVTADDLLARPPAARVPAPGDRAAGAGGEILVVIPFRDRDPRRLRLRNLLACLASLHDQSVPRDRYRLMVVECDETPRWGETLRPRVDDYLFAPKPGTFNKSWAVNTGVVNASRQPDVICVLDADVLADRDFIARNAARFRKPGTAGHLTYRDMLCMDPAATAWAIRRRLHDGEPAADPAGLRGMVLRRPPGCCLWVRHSAFHRVNGMDERFEGWGGEDNDFAYRFDTLNAFDHYDDRLLHMHHPSSAVLREDGELVNTDIPALSWAPDEAIGRLDRFAPQT